jgi:membrane protein
MDIQRPIRSFDRFQQRHKSLAIPLAVVRKFGNDQAGSLAALVAYYGFFSIFPLLLAMTTILGFVLHGDISAQQSVEKSVVGQFPVIGKSITTHQLSGHIGALLVGVLGALWGGLGVTQASQNAFNRVWAVPFKDRPNYLKSRLRGLLLLFSLGALFLISTIVSGLVTGLGGPEVKVAGFVIAFAVNFALFLTAFRFLTSASVPTSSLWIGVVFASVFWEILQAAGGLYIGHVLRHASATYSLFALPIALLVWLHLGAQMTLYAAEINTVVTRKLWPRSLMGPPEAPADQETLTALAKVEERHEDEHVEVEFDAPTADAPTADAGRAPAPEQPTGSPKVPG